MMIPRFETVVVTLASSPVVILNVLLYILISFFFQLEEMMRCPDCYLMSNLRTKNWFCKPCVSLAQFFKALLS